MQALGITFLLLLLVHVDISGASKSLPPYTSKLPQHLVDLFTHAFTNCVVTLEGSAHGDHLLRSADLEAYAEFLQESGIPTVLPPSWEKSARRWKKFINMETGVMQNEELPTGNHLKHLECKAEIIFVLDNAGTNLSHPKPLHSTLIFNGLENELQDLMIVDTSVDGKALSFNDKMGLFSSFVLAPGHRATVLEIADDNEQVNLICVPCDAQLRTVIFPLIPSEFRGTNLQQRLRLFSETKRRSRGVILSILPGYYLRQLRFQAQYKRKTCGNSIYLDRVASPFEAADCVNLQIAQELNVTFAPPGQPSLVQMVAHFYTTGLLQDHVLDEYRERVGNIILLDIIPYRFIIVLDNQYVSKSNISSFLRSMDEFTWVFTWLAIVAISVLFWVLRVQERKISLRDLIYCVLALFETLLNQALPRMYLKRQLLPVLVLWLLGTVVLSNGYTGILSALMTKHIIPPVPESLSDLAQSPLGVFSTSYVLKQRFVGSNAMVAVPSPPPMVNISTCKACNQVQNSTIYVLMPEGIPQPQTLYKQFLKSIRSNSPMNTTVGLKIVPPNFALLEGHTAGQTMHVIRAALGGRKQIVYVGSANPFVYIKIWTSAATYISGLLARPLSALMESGIYGYWKQIQELAEEYHWNSLAVSGVNLDRDSSRPPSALLFNLPRVADPPRRMWMGVIQNPLLVFGVCCEFSVVVFLTEILIGKLANVCTNLVFDRSTNSQ